MRVVGNLIRVRRGAVVLFCRRGHKWLMQLRRLADLVVQARSIEPEHFSAVEAFTLATILTLQPARPKDVRTPEFPHTCFATRRQASTCAGLQVCSMVTDGMQLLGVDGLPCDEALQALQQRGFVVQRTKRVFSLTAPAMEVPWVPRNADLKSRIMRRARQLVLSSDWVNKVIVSAFIAVRQACNTLILQPLLAENVAWCPAWPARRETRRSPEERFVGRALLRLPYAVPYCPRAGLRKVCPCCIAPNLRVLPSRRVF